MPSVEWIDAPTRSDLEKVVGLLSGFWREVIPGEPDQPLEEIEAEMTDLPEHRRSYLAVASEGEELVGTARLTLMDVSGRAEIANADFLVVHPELRRRGVGRGLLNLLVRRSTASGRTRLKAFAPSAQDGAAALAASLGARPGLIDHHNRLRVEDLDRGLLESWVERAPERARGYSLVSFDGMCPDPWIRSFTKLVAVMNTAPHSDDDPEWVLTSEQLREGQEAETRRGEWRWAACARHDESGELVGFTEMTGSKGRPWLAFQGDTGVEPAHRDRGLGRWLKAVNALRLLDERPDVTAIDTWNAGVNAPMLSINHAMGFRRIGTWQEWTLQL